MINIKNIDKKDYKFISHIPEELLDEKRIKNFLLARDEEDKKMTKLNSLPYHYVVEPTNSCNLKCPLCPTGLKIDSRKKGILKIDQFKKILNKIEDSALAIYLQNWGEATLLKYLPEMIKLCSEKNIYTNLSTNFSINYKNDFLLNLIKSGLTVLHIDLDGTTAETYSKYRISGDLDVVLKNIKEVVSIKKNLGLKYPIIETTMMAMKHNEHEIEDFKILSKELNVDQFNVGKIQVNPALNSSKKWLPENEDLIYSSYLKKKNPGPCHWPWSGMVINWDGNISACCIVDDVKADFGNIFNNDLKKIWNNTKYVSARSEFGNQNEITQKTICNVCKNDTHNPNLKRKGESFSISF